MLNEARFDVVLDRLVDAENNARIAATLACFRFRFGDQLAEFATGVVGSDDVRIDGVRISPEGEQWRRVQPCMDCGQDDWLMTNVRAHNATSLRALIDAEIKTTCPECMRIHNEKIQQARGGEREVALADEAASPTPLGPRSLLQRISTWLRRM